MFSQLPHVSQWCLFLKKQQQLKSPKQEAVPPWSRVVWPRLPQRPERQWFHRYHLQRHHGTLRHQQNYKNSSNSISDAGWQKLCKGMKGLRQKVWTWTKILSSNIRSFVAILRFDLILGRLSARSLFCKKQCFLGKKCTITWYILHICDMYNSMLYWIKFANLQLCAKKTNLSRK